MSYDVGNRAQLSAASNTIYGEFTPCTKKRFPLSHSSFLFSRNNPFVHWRLSHENNKSRFTAHGLNSLYRYSVQSLLFLNPESVCYFAGANWWPFYRSKMGTKTISPVYKWQIFCLPLHLYPSSAVKYCGGVLPIFLCKAWFTAFYVHSCQWNLSRQKSLKGVQNDSLHVTR